MSIVRRGLAATGGAVLLFALFFGFIELFGTARAAVADARTTLRTNEIVEHYLATRPVRKLQIGAGTNNLDGWLNTDLSPGAGQAYLDAAGPYPLPDASFDFVFAEQLVEHLSVEQGQSMFRECLRILRPGGRIRIATPDLARLIALFHKDRSEQASRYLEIEMSKNKRWPRITGPEATVLNMFLREWGHQFVYDAPSLNAALRAAGFQEVRETRLGESSVPEFRGIERHSEVTGREITEYTTMVLEARK